jgi:hypothetical protein
MLILGAVIRTRQNVLVRSKSVVSNNYRTNGDYRYSNPRFSVHITLFSLILGYVNDSITIDLS